MESAFSETRRAAGLLQQFSGFPFCRNDVCFFPLSLFSATHRTRSCPAALFDLHGVFTALVCSSSPQTLYHSFPWLPENSFTPLRLLFPQSLRLCGSPDWRFWRYFSGVYHLRWWVFSCRGAFSDLWPSFSLTIRSPRVRLTVNYFWQSFRDRMVTYFSPLVKTARISILRLSILR